MTGDEVTKGSQKRRKAFGDMRDVGVYGSIPFMFLVGPGLGYLAGRWLEGRWVEAPWGVVGGVALGFAGAVKAVVDVLREQTALEEAKAARRRASEQALLGGGGVQKEPSGKPERPPRRSQENSQDGSDRPL